MCLWRAVTMNGRVRWRLARVYTHTHIYTLESRVYPSTHGRTTLLERYFCKVLLARLTRTCMREITGWLTATLSCRFDYILFPLSLSRFLSSFLPLAHTRHARHLSALGGEKIKKKKKNTNGQCRRSARFFGSTLNAFQARRKKLTVRHRLLTGKPLAWLDTVLFSCAHVPRSVNKNDTCLYPASVEIIYVKSRLSGRDREEACEFWYNRNLISPLWSLLHDNC